MSNVVATPHIGSATQETRRAMAELAVKNLREGLRGERPADLVNPSVWEKQPPRFRKPKTLASYQAYKLYEETYIPTYGQYHRDENKGSNSTLCKYRSSRIIVWWLHCCEIR